MYEEEGQRTRWKDLVNRVVRELGLQEEEARDGCKWKTITRAADPTTQWESGRMKMKRKKKMMKKYEKKGSEGSNN